MVFYKLRFKRQYKYILIWICFGQLKFDSQRQFAPKKTKPQARADNANRGLDNSRYHAKPTSIIIFIIHKEKQSLSRCVLDNIFTRKYNALQKPLASFYWIK